MESSTPLSPQSGASIDSSSQTPVSGPQSPPRTPRRHVRVVEEERPQWLRQRRLHSGLSTASGVVSPSAYSARSAYSRIQTPGTRTPLDPHSPRASLSTLHLQHLLENLQMDQFDTFGVEENRDGFFDATFYKTSRQGAGPLEGGYTPNALPTRRFSQLLLVQLEDIKFFFTSIMQRDDAILLLKAFLSYFIAYVLCLVPAIHYWLGRYPQWMIIAALFNHSGRTVGAQIDGSLALSLGGALGLAIGCLALQLASISDVSREAYGAILAVFVVPPITVMSWVRCSMLRFYQTMLSAGLAVIFLCLVETGAIVEKKGWNKELVWDFAVPWLIGIGVCLLVNAAICPETGRKPIADALHSALQSSIQSLDLPRAYSLELHRHMSARLVQLSEAVRDMRNEITFTALSPTDAETLRNMLQTVVRDLMAVKPETCLFESDGSEDPDDVRIQIEEASLFSVGDRAVETVRGVMATPCRDLIESMRNTLHCCDQGMMKIIWEPNVTELVVDLDVATAVRDLRHVVERFDAADVSLIDHPQIPSSYSSHPELVELFLFIHPIRQAASSVEVLASKVLEISTGPVSSRKRVFLPSYPISRAIHRTNPQVRHDRGGATAGYYFRVKDDLDSIMDKIHARTYSIDPEQSGKQERERGIMTADKNTVRYRTWSVLHRLQQFESRFALKVVCLTVLLSIPAWLPQSRSWWTEHEAWWAVVAAWFMMHPRAGGNMQDLVTRSIATVSGAVWGGLTYKIGSSAGSACLYVMAVLTAIFMIPAIFRFMLSSHARSGLMACLSYSIVSLSAYKNAAAHSAAQVAWTRGIALLVGVVSAIVVNWLVWPFVARHELRKSLGSTLLYLGVSYRSVVARYIYHDLDYQPSQQDIEMSEVQEAKLREACYRMRELVDMSGHEIRPRGTFDPGPYTEAIDACERILEHIIEVRKSSLYFYPYLFQRDEEITEQLISPRRDAVATILMNLYTLAGALRSKQPVPRYLPSAAAARKRLLDCMAHVESEWGSDKVLRPRPEKSRRWADVYHYAYSAALTDIVAQIELLEAIAKHILGELQLDAPELISR